MKTSLILILFCIVAIFSYGQDKLEYHYLLPMFPKNDSRSVDKKQKIEGWAIERIKEEIDRGAIAISNDKGVYLSWRLLTDDPENISFNVYHSTNGKSYKKLNNNPIQSTCDYFHKNGKLTSRSTYKIRMVTEGKENEEYPVENLGDGFLSIKFQGDYQPEKVAIADLNGDGTYDYVIKQPHKTLGGGIRGIQSVANKDLTYKLEGYLHDGTFLWQIDLGLGIEPGIWYSPFIVYDLDGDGKAEVAAKTSGTDFVRDELGRVVSGSEHLTIFNGMTGKPITQTDWIPRTKRLGNYTRINRNQMGIAFLDGRTPFLLIERGTYKAMFLEAFTFKKKTLTKHWHWDGDEENPIVRHQGSHYMLCADVDNDGRDEVVLGSVVIDDTGDALYSTGYGHPDRCYVTDILPSNPGLEIFYCLEDTHEDGNGVCLVDAKTGKTIWNIGHKTIHVGEGMAADILPENPGLECWAGESAKAGSSDRYMLTADGKYLARNAGVPPFTSWLFWDADLLRERVNSTYWSDYKKTLNVYKYDGTEYTENIQGRVISVADILGDWREEILVSVPGELRIYTTTIPAKDKRVILMQDPVYRINVAHQSMGYIQPPVTSYYLGE